MDKAKSKRARIGSGISILLCCGMLIGTTFAWFTDTETSATNTIKAGNLDMEVSFRPYGEAGDNWTSIDGNTDIFGKDALYEPGYTEAVWLKVENHGSLAFEYGLDVHVADETPGVNQAVDEFWLSDYITVMSGPVTTDYKTVESTYDTREKLLENYSWATSGIIGDGENSDGFGGAATLAENIESIPNSSSAVSYVCVVLHMPETVGNAANHNGTTIPEILLGIDAYATQAVHESDAFDVEYDINAN